MSIIETINEKIRFKKMHVQRSKRAKIKHISKIMGLKVKIFLLCLT